ncbi:MAG: protease modulator HflC [Rhodospirillales bacterium]
MRGRIPLIIGIGVIALGILIYSASFIVYQTQQAVVLQFGDPKRVISTPGLHFKLPFIQNVRYLENRVLNLDPSSQTVLLEDNRRLVVDAFVRYRIDDPLVFIRSVGTESILDGRLSPVVNDAVRGVFGEATLTDVVSSERARLMTEIRDRVNRDTTRFGINIVDVRIGRADLAPQVAEAVYARMRAERERLAADFRARGQEQFQTVTAQADREATVIRAEAQRQADILRGEGEGQRTNILNEAYSKDPEFFRFSRTMEAYRKAIDPGTTSMVLTTDSEFFEFFNQATTERVGTLEPSNFVTPQQASSDNGSTAPAVPADDASTDDASTADTDSTATPAATTDEAATQDGTAPATSN